MPASEARILTPRSSSRPVRQVEAPPAPLSEDVDVRVPPDEIIIGQPPALDYSAKHLRCDYNGMMSDGKHLPARYVCHVCGVCVATGEGHQNDEADVHVFRHLHGSVAEDQASKTVSCPSCNQALGSRGGNTILLRKGRVVMQQDKLEILVCSLKEREITEVKPAIQEAFPHCNITPRVLQKSELRGFELSQATRKEPDLVVVVHRNEGRALLTDRNGFYHDVLGSAWRRTRGNVLVILTRTEPKGDATELFDSQLLRALSTQGDQPTIGALSACGRVLTWESQPSKPQLQQLQLLSEKAYFREPLAAVQGLPVAWSKTPQRSPGSNPNWCSVL